MIIKWFGESIRVPAQILALGVVNESFQNDMSPSVMFPANSTGHDVSVQIFISGEEALGEGLKKFHCWVHGVEPEAWFDTDDVGEAVAFCRGVAAATGMGTDFKRKR